MSLPPDTDPIEPAAEPASKPWRRWLPLAIVAVIAGTIAIIAVASGGDDDTTSDTATSVGQSVEPTDSAATTAEQGSNGASSTSVSDSGSPTTNAASTTSAGSLPAATDTTVATSPTDSTASGTATTIPAAPATPIHLGTAADFAALGNTGVGNTGATTVIGQIGASNGLPTGFSSSDAGLIIVGAQTAQQAQLAVDDAVGEIDGLAATELPATDLGTQTIGPGTYSSATLDVSGTVTLDAGGDPNALFVFVMASTLTVADSTQIVLAGGAQACNVYWRLGSTATLGSGSTLVGTLIADDSVTAANDIGVVGRLIARNGSVTLDSDSIAISTCA